MKHLFSWIHMVKIKKEMHGLWPVIAVNVFVKAIAQSYFFPYMAYI